MQIASAMTAMEEFSSPTGMPWIGYIKSLLSSPTYFFFITESSPSSHTNIYIYTFNSLQVSNAAKRHLIL
jgi:hypothetical protein